MCAARQRRHWPRSRRRRIAEVGADRVVEHVRVLCHHTDRVPQRPQSHVSDVVGHRRGRRPGDVVQPGDQWVIVVLPAPDGPTSATIGPGRRRERDVVQDLLARGAVEDGDVSSEASDTSLRSGS